MDRRDGAPAVDRLRPLAHVGAHFGPRESGDVIFTLLGFAGLYLLLGVLFVVQVLRQINRGPVASTRTLSWETVWFVIVSAMLAVYAVLDGFDFGVGASTASSHAPIDDAGRCWRRSARSGTAMKSG